jgi:hypothetical protein
MTRKTWLVLSLAAAAVACVCVVQKASAGPYGAPRFYMLTTRYLPGETITFKLRHDQHNKVPFMAETWDVVDAEGNVIAQYYWNEDQRRIPPHAYWTWHWDQRQACYGACQNVREGDPIVPGRYRIVTTVDGKEVSKAFSVGQYFHMAFEGRPNADFVVYSNNADVVERMRAELQRPEEERQFVTGIVRQRKPGYNPRWSYVLDPPTIDLAEASIEVCDGSPYYVEHHLKQWRGQQWCPWSSHVASEGL